MSPLLKYLTTFQSGVTQAALNWFNKQRTLKALLYLCI
uniref:Uncharacterized protein n=1 Tax=Anguilla anguilla TaxID=7936 RepID=A0A0E9XHA4_ANGAN